MCVNPTFPLAAVSNSNSPDIDSIQDLEDLDCAPVISPAIKKFSVYGVARQVVVASRQLHTGTPEDAILSVLRVATSARETNLVSPRIAHVRRRITHSNVSWY